MLEVKMDNNPNINSKQDEKLSVLESQTLDPDNKPSNLESADIFLQEANRQLTGRTSLIDRKN